METIIETAELALVREIQVSHEAATTAAASAKTNVGKALSEAIKCGHLLISAKGQFGQHGRWLSWLETNLPAVSRQVSARWMKLAANQTSLNGASSQKEAWTALGLIESASREPGSQQAAAPVCKWLSLLSKTWAELETLTVEKINDWPEIERQLLRRKLEPLAELFATLEP